MINILIHGMGQNESSWDKVKTILNEDNIDVKTPNVFEIAKNYQLNYDNLYRAFADYCNGFKEKLNLVGLSLGGILAIDYAVEYPQKVNSIILSGTPYELPKKLLRFQNFVFKLIPKKNFENIGISKKNFIELSNSLAELNIKFKVSKIQCNTLIICGEKDTLNMESARQLNSNIKNSKIKVIQGAGHEINIDTPEEFANTIKEFYYNK